MKDDPQEAGIVASYSLSVFAGDKDDKMIDYNKKGLQFAEKRSSLIISGYVGKSQSTG